MTKLKIPPGPWGVAESDGQYCVFATQTDNGDVVAIADPDNIAEELGQSAEAIANLIAAAPDMLVALRAMIGAMDDNTLRPSGKFDPEISGNARAAIALATGDRT